MYRSTSLHSVSRCPLAIYISLLLFALSPCAQSQTLTTLYSFTGPDGAEPYAGLIKDSHGNLFGTTTYGGSQSGGNVFELTSSGTEKVVYDFCSQANCTDGMYPFGPLLLDSEGNLYGTTSLGGTGTDCDSGCGMVFKVTPSGVETVLYNFCTQTNCADGASPYAGLVSDADGNLYGTTSAGGAYGNGTVFELAPDGTETVIYSFTGGIDGGEPLSSLIRDSAGNLYGTTYSGGLVASGSFCEHWYGQGCGVAFEITSSGTERVLWEFKGGDNGFLPSAGLVMDSKGNLYGTTYGNSLGYYCGKGWPPCHFGTVFEITPKGTRKILYRFTGGTDGAFPRASVTLDTEGNVYGTTENGGESGYGCYACGTVFRVTPKGIETVVSSFANSNGAFPNGAVLLDSSGNLFGTTTIGGTAGYGTVFEIAP